jgi:quercetin dioxygenase-like cupin family protein
MLLPENAIITPICIKHSLPQTLLIKINTAFINLRRRVTPLNLIRRDRFHFQEGQRMTRKKANPTVQIDDMQVKVTRWDFSPGAETGWHTHAMDYIVVPLTEGTLKAELPSGSTVENKLTVGASYARPAGVNHNIINMNHAPFSFIEIELK